MKLKLQNDCTKHIYIYMVIIILDCVSKIAYLAERADALYSKVGIPVLQSQFTFIFCRALCTYNIYKSQVKWG